jgi:hypothetical protein
LEVSSLTWENNNSSDSLAGIEGGNECRRGKSNNNNKEDNNKISLLKQLHSNVREQLSNHIWEIISYSPPKFLVAHSDYKQIIYATLKEEESRKLVNLNRIENGFKEIIISLYVSRIVIGAIPVEVILNKNPLGLYDHKYTIKFETHSNDSFTIGPKNLDEIVSYLKDKSLIYMSTKTSEALSIIICAFERNGQLIVKNDMETSGFYFIDGKIKQYNGSNNNSNNHPKPTLEQIKQCCDLLDTLQTQFKNKDVFPTLVKWSIIAPFDYVLKQVHKKWIPWLYPYGWANTGKSTLGEICCCIWNRYQDKDSILPFTAVDTKARLGEALSKSTYPIVINEVAQLTDENRNRDMVDMIKTAITDLNARKKFVNKTVYTDIPSFSPSILTGNSLPPTDTGFRRRVIPIIFTEKDQYSEDEVRDFKELFDQRVKHELRYLGDFTVNYVMEHQKLLFDGKKDWKEIAEIILTEMYKSVERELPEWIKYFVKENQMADSKEDVELLFRSFLINIVNETYNKYYRNIEKIFIVNSDSDAEVPNLPFSSRLDFCLKHNLIPFLNPIRIDDENIMIAITSDLVHELKKKIPQISSLYEVAAIIDGFEYEQKRIGGKNIRVAYGTKKKLLDLLGVK